MNRAIFFILAVYAAVIVYAIIKRFHRRENCDESSDFDTARVMPDVEALSADMRRLKELDEMMLDLRVCSPEEMQRSFRVEWLSTSGINHKLDILADGENASSERLFMLAAAERDELNAKISKRINSLYFRAAMLDAERKTERKTIDGGREDAANG